MHRESLGGHLSRVISVHLLRRRRDTSSSALVRWRMRPARQRRSTSLPGNRCKPGSPYRVPPGRRPSGPQCATSSCICMGRRGAPFGSWSSSPSSGRMKTGQIFCSEHRDAAHRLVKDPVSCTLLKSIYLNNCQSSNVFHFAAQRTVNARLREGTRYVVWVPNRRNAPRSHSTSQLLVGRRA